MYRLPDDSERRCPDDGAKSDLLQPDDRAPRRVLLVCTRCRGWRVLAFVRQPDGADAWVQQAAHFDRRTANPAAAPA